MHRNRLSRPPLAAALLLALLTSACLFSSRSRYTPDEITDETQRLNLFFQECFLTRLDRKPTLRSRLGIKKNYDKWDDLSLDRAREDMEILKRDLERLRTEFRFERLDAEAKLSFRLFEYETELEIEGFRWRLHDYPVNQMHGVQAETPAFLVNVHRIDDPSDADAYIARLHGIRTLFEQVVANLEAREEMGILPPAFVFPKVLDDCRNVLVGEPFTGSDRESTLLADFRRKVAGLKGVGAELGARLDREARNALLNSVRPAYEKLIETLERQQRLATKDDGVWKLPEGQEFYRFTLRRATTTDLSPERIHELGLAEVARLHAEMRSILVKVAFEGELAEFFQDVRADPRFYYPNDDAGRSAYLAEARAILARMELRLDELFLTRPAAPMIVKAVEAFREKSAGKAFYSRGTPDGSRPGVYYANLYDMSAMPKYQMEALAYHEGIPGHHMQLSIAQELPGLPEFRKHGQYTAYTEGWGLYSEFVPKEMGFYAEAYSDFGRLAMELWRACRLVVDTGIHHYRWTRRRAVDYLRENTPNPESDCQKAIERYIVMPGQATAYKIGMIKILELRQHAQSRLRARFDVREFHDVVLRSGPVPLDLLEGVVERWIAAKSAK